MRYRSLGTTGVKVSPLCLGAMMFGAMGNPDHDDCIRIIHRALDAGINFVDTADVYSAGESEEIVGKALAGRRDGIVLATKLHAPMSQDPNEKGNSRRWIVREVENSLRRLQTDRIDLYQVHRPEPGTDVDDTLSALSDLVHQGKVNYLGSSTFPAEAIVEAQWTAERRGHERFRVEQPPYSIFVRGIEEAVLPTCEQYGMGVIPWSPLNGGFLTGRYRPGEDAPKVGRAARTPDRFDPERPGVQRKLEAHSRAGESRGRRRDAAHPPRDRLHARAPGHQLGNHRAAHDGATRRAARRRCRARRRDARSDRCPGSAGHERQPRRVGLGPSRTQPGVAAPPPDRIPLMEELRRTPRGEAAH